MKNSKNVLEFDSWPLSAQFYHNFVQFNAEILKDIWKNTKTMTQENVVMAKAAVPCRNLCSVLLFVSFVLLYSLNIVKAGYKYLT